MKLASIATHVHPRRDMLFASGAIVEDSQLVVLQFHYGLLSLVTQSIVPYSPYDRLSKFARPSLLSGRLPLSQMSRPLLLSSCLLQVVACLTFF